MTGIILSDMFDSHTYVTINKVHIKKNYHSQTNHSQTNHKKHANHKLFCQQIQVLYLF